MRDPKVLVFDIETFPLEVRVWELGDQNVTVGQVVKDWSVAAWAAKWLGTPERTIMYEDTCKQRDVRDDSRILRRIWNLLDQADIVVTQNGKKFDSRKLNARFIERGMGLPSPYEHLDTYRIAKRVAAFTSHKLEYLTEHLNTKYKKLSHKNFPGLSLWDECLLKNPKAWAEMKKYNKHDVFSTEELYINLRAYAPENAPAVHEVANPSVKCRTCGITGQMEKKGVRRNKVYRYQRYHCKNCGSSQVGEKI